jgi:predicted permease
VSVYTVCIGECSYIFAMLFTSKIQTLVWSDHVPAALTTFSQPSLFFPFPLFAAHKIDRNMEKNPTLCYIVIYLCITSFFLFYCLFCVQHSEQNQLTNQPNRKKITHKNKHNLMVFNAQSDQHHG